MRRLADLSASQAPDSSVIFGKHEGGPLGMNDNYPGGFWTGTDNKRRYVKAYDDESQIYCEILAGAIYKALGHLAPVAYKAQHNGKPVFVSEIVDGEGTLDQVGLNPKIAEAIAEAFALDVLLGNWDVTGGIPQGANMFIQNGRPVRIDNGGTLLMRAANGRKPKHLLHDITEWEGYFDSNLNWDFASTMRKAGYRKAEDMGEALVGQIMAIEDFYQQHGGWDNIVRKVVPDWEGRDREEAVAMLESRTKLLSQKKANIQRQLETKRVSHLAMTFLKTRR